MGMNRNFFSKTACYTFLGALALTHQAFAVGPRPTVPASYTIDYGNGVQQVTIVGSIRTIFPPVPFSDGRTENQNIYRPGSPVYQTLTFQRPMDDNRYLWDWIEATRNGDDTRKTITVVMLDDRLETIRTWILYDCLPRTIRQVATSESGILQVFEEVTVQAVRIESL